MSQACFSACLADVTGYLLKHLARDIPTNAFWATNNGNISGHRDKIDVSVFLVNYHLLYITGKCWYKSR